MKRRAHHIFHATFIIFFTVLALGPIQAAEILPESRISGHEGRKWAFCIGVSNYKAPEIIDLPKARNDAKGLARVLKESGGFEQIFVFTDDLDRNDPYYPSKRNIQSAFDRYAKIIQPGDFILFSFSGQGIYDADGRAFLLTADTRVRRLNSTALPLSNILTLIKKTGVNRSIILLDASREKIIKRMGEFSGGIYPDRYLIGGVSAIFYASRKGLYSHDDEGSDYGVFTRFLISGIEGEADIHYGGNGDGMITLEELGGYVQDRVTRWSLERTERQIPFIRIQDRVIGDMTVSSIQRVEIREAATAGPPTPEIGEMVQIAPPAPGIEEILEEKKPGDAQRRVSIKEEEVTPGPGAKEQQGFKKKEVPETGVQTAMIKEGRKESQKEKGQEISVGAPPHSAAKMSEDTAIERAAPGALEVPGMVNLEEKEAKEEGLELEIASLPRKVKPEPIYLRRDARNITPEDVKDMLFRYQFYATCWNYNGDFCNPEGDFENYFVDNQNGTVTDQATGLMWQKSGSSKRMTWLEAKEYVREINREGIAGHHDWRLPTVEEFASLMERSWKNSDLFIDPVFNKKQRYCWTVDANGMNKAWKANFHLGFIVDFPMTSQNSTRLVRSLP